MSTSVSVVIPSYKGVLSLPRTLGACLMTATAARIDHEILLIDDHSDDGSIRMVQERYPRVRIVSKRKHTGWAETYYLGAQQARGDIVVFVQQAVVPKEAFLKNLLEPLFDNSQVFGVTARLVGWRRSAADHAAVEGRWENGGLRFHETDPDQPVHNVFLHPGAMAVRSKAFLELGGFYPRYFRELWMAYDLSYKARKAGWNTVFVPDAEASIFSGATRVQSDLEVEQRAQDCADRTLFHWLNITEAALLKSMTKSYAATAWKSCLGEGADRDEIRGIRIAQKLLNAVDLERAKRLLYNSTTDNDLLCVTQ